MDYGNLTREQLIALLKVNDIMPQDDILKMESDVRASTVVRADGAMKYSIEPVDIEQVAIMNAKKIIVIYEQRRYDLCVFSSLHYDSYLGLSLEKIARMHKLYIQFAGAFKQVYPSQFPVYFSEHLVIVDTMFMDFISSIKDICELFSCI